MRIIWSRIWYSQNWHKISSNRRKIIFSRAVEPLHQECMLNAWLRSHLKSLEISWNQVYSSIGECLNPRKIFVFDVRLLIKWVSAQIRWFSIVRVDVHHLQRVILRNEPGRELGNWSGEMINYVWEIEMRMRSISNTCVLKRWTCNKSLRHWWKLRYRKTASIPRLRNRLKSFNIGSSSFELPSNHLGPFQTVSHVRVRLQLPGCTLPAYRSFSPWIYQATSVRCVASRRVGTITVVTSTRFELRMSFWACLLALAISSTM